MRGVHCLPLSEAGVEPLRGFLGCHPQALLGLFTSSGCLPFAIFSGSAVAGELSEMSRHGSDDDAEGTKGTTRRTIGQACCLLTQPWHGTDIGTEALEALLRRVVAVAGPVVQPQTIIPLSEVNEVLINHFAAQ